MSVAASWCRLCTSSHRAAVTTAALRLLLGKKGGNGDSAVLCLNTAWLLSLPLGYASGPGKAQADLAMAASPVLLLLGRRSSELLG